MVRRFAVLALSFAPSLAFAQATFQSILVNGGASDATPALQFSNQGAKIYFGQSDYIQDVAGVLTWDAGKFQVDGAGNVTAFGKFTVGTAGAKVCLNGSSCSTYVRDDGFGALQLIGNAGILLNSNGSSTNVALDFHVDTNKNKSINITGDNVVDPTISAVGTNVSVSIVPTGTGSVKNNGDPIPAVHAAQVATQQSIEFGGLIASSGSASKTFSTAFSSAPTCVCSDATATVSGCNVTAASTTAATFKVTGVSDALNFYCIGAR